MKKFTDVASLIAARNIWEKKNIRVGFVPTMGALHEGHMSLIKAAQEVTDSVVVSIFVNPTQFGPNEDLNSYPSMIEEDLRALEKEGVDATFLPTPSAMYPAGFQSYVINNEASLALCGGSRPGHFQGVLTVVLKLLNLVHPHSAFFGAKDYQQLALIRTMARDFHLRTKIVSCPTVREDDGLAMSSRNLRLKAGERELAPAIYRAMIATKNLYATGERSILALLERFKNEVSDPSFEIDYVEIRDGVTLGAYEDMIEPEVGVPHLFCAVNLGAVRLIDNVPLE